MSHVISVKTKSMELLKTQRELPIYAARRRLTKELANRRSCIIIGETGSGKTTQVPQMIYRARLHADKIIACTQPRRVAAVTIATRVAQEMGCNVGDLVGYCVRFDDTTSAHTKIKYMTDGMLLRESVLDPLLSRYSFIILDEAHERTLHTDILFGIVKSAQHKRKHTNNQLKLVIMSATMDADHFSNFFKSQVLYLEGRTFPVECFYTEEKQTDYVYSSMVTALQIHRNTPVGEDILIFLTGEEEIESTVKTLRDVSKSLQGPALLVYPMYSKLTSEAQLRIFSSTPQGCRKCIVSTNIAETSVTISGIKHVIDSGKVKIKTYTGGVDTLKVCDVSKAQAWQRLGRAGRISSGSCYRLYTEEQFESFQDNTTPEILRCNLSSVILQLYALGIENVSEFNFMDKPSNEIVDSSVEMLVHLGAVHKSDNQTKPKQITQLGKKMAAFPVDPRLAKCLITSHSNNCLEEMLTVVSMLSVDNVFVTSRNQDEEGVELHRKFQHNEGDHLTLMNVYRSFKGAGGQKDWCSRNRLNFRNLKTAQDVRRQLVELCERNELTPIKSAGINTHIIRKSLLSGYFMNVAHLGLFNQFKLLLGGKPVSIHPSSTLFQKRPQYLIFTEIVQTNKAYMRNVSMIEEDYLLEILPENLRRKLKSKHHSEH